MRSPRALVAAFLLGGLFPVAGPTVAACAAEGPSAVLVVDTERPAGQHRLCVALPDPSVTGIELIELANQQHGLQYRLGYGGNVVCQLAGVGYQSDECLNDGPEFWGYWRGDGSGGWEWSSGGGNSTVVRDGDVEGWSWGTGNDGSSHPAPPETTFASVCGRSAGSPEQPKDNDKGDGNKDPQPKGDPSGGASGKDTDASAAIPEIGEQIEAARKAGSKREGGPKKERSRRDRDGSKDKDRSRGAGDESPSMPSPGPVATVVGSEDTSFTDESPNGIPLGGVIAVGAVIACITGGVILRRRRTGER
jgi:hypothetical protein